MKTATSLVAAAAAVLLALAPAHAHEQHGTRGYAAGEPGDPKQPSRTVEVLLSEMEFTPARIEVKRGEQIRFVLRNTGKEDHEFLLATKAENLKHAAVMKKHPHMEHDEPNGARLAPGKTAELLWRFSKQGTFEYSCLIPDHREFGMTGHVTVK
ncbi:putative Copper tolerance protein (Cupredoxin) [Bradyrhizobium sp. ORS 285]|uniref:cupredoxin domain-containing protein n=1 Tax=Bradyrhizobium sp. ORS 285 TaxID=115808 RepID=UPI0002409A93|nr:cupredoxin family protein [Bradyrhizobium sp. ORS 285]CCD87548.1 putative Copper tolerance protein (Cupredoxin) [Bradyrhizobium sp. ORS 285]SMX60661.1 putative Copper tolerance protein (Cupredoxin) [Bradyrhizobium sp. ORS 285]